MWIGYAIYGLAFGAWGLIALGGRAIIIASIWFVTAASAGAGVPPRVLMLRLWLPCLYGALAAAGFVVLRFQ